MNTTKKMGCPVCAGETDQRELLLRSLCEKHFAEVAPIPEEVLLEALMEGMRARKACIDAYIPPVLPDGLRYR